MSQYVNYTERLTGSTVEVELPQTRDDEFELLSMVNRLANDNPDEWKSTMRMYTACDYYFLALMLSGTQRLDPFTGRPEIDCDYLFDYFREVQFNNDRWLDKSARGHWKSTVRTYVGIINLIITDPNIVIALAAHEKAAAYRHGWRSCLELANNVELKTAWDDALWADPYKEAPLWNQETGCTVRRTLPAILPTLSWHSILSAPTGSRISVFVLDDIEEESTVETAEMRAKTLNRVASFLETAGRLPRVWVNGTHFHSQGVVAHLEAAGSFNVRCHPIEDVTKEPPDIAALYDACGGVMPTVVGEKQVLPPAVRDIRLDGAPIYLHPLEVALKRLDAMAMPGGLDNYYRQNFGDAMVGQQRRLDADWIRWYDEDPVDRARGGFGYLTIDPSKGINDPTVARLEVTHDNGTISWVAAIRRKLSPSQFAPAILNFALAWSDIVDIRQIRVEEFGQSTWSFMLRDYFNRLNKWVAPIIACTSSTNNKEKQGRLREWLGLEPLYRQGRRYYPMVGIMVSDERGNREYDEVRRYINDEYSVFPICGVDDGLAADYLLAASKGRNEAGQMVDLQLEYPDYSESSPASFKAAWRRHHHRDSMDGAGEPTWMSAGLTNDDWSTVQ